jgi:menaquinone-dependent protoporphyrinogen oxidase
MSSDSVNRREFLTGALKYSSLSLLAFNFGCSISTLIDSSSSNAALVYGTKYGSTKDTANWIKNGARGKIDLLNIEHISYSEISSRYDLFIIGSGVWIGGVHEKLVEFLTSQADMLDDKVIASFIVCGTDGSTAGGKKRIDGYFEQLHEPLQRMPVLSEYFGGRITVEQLTEEDREALEQFYQTYLKTELTSWDRTDPEKAKLYGKDLVNSIEKYQKKETA